MPKYPLLLKSYCAMYFAFIRGARRDAVYSVTYIRSGATKYKCERQSAICFDTFIFIEYNQSLSKKIFGETNEEKEKT